MVDCWDAVVNASYCCDLFKSVLGSLRCWLPPLFTFEICCGPYAHAPRAALGEFARYLDGQPVSHVGPVPTAELPRCLHERSGVGCENFSYDYIGQSLSSGGMFTSHAGRICAPPPCTPGMVARLLIPLDLRRRDLLPDSTLDVPLYTSWRRAVRTVPPKMPDAPGAAGGHDKPRMLAGIQLARAPFASNFAHLPVQPREFWLEVGANDFNLLQHTAQMRAAFERGAFLISFEPLLEKYAELLSRHGRGRNHTAARRLGFHHDRGLVLPYAVGCQGSTVLHVTPNDGCSSLLSPRADEFASDPMASAWSAGTHEGCAVVAEERVVPCVSLAEVIGGWLQGHAVRHLKIDAQGFDLAVVKSSGEYVDRLKSVTMEAVCDNAAALYKGQPTCSQVYEEMLALGFVAQFDPDVCQSCKEVDINFRRA